MVGIGVGAGVGLASGDVSRKLRVPDGGKCPPERKRCGTLGVGVALGFLWEPFAGSSTKDGGEGAIRVVCNDEGGSFVRWVHGGGHEMSGIKVPM
jgi:hypothetical protein